MSPHRNLQRIAIFGQPGSGKSTLARALGDRLGLPVIHLDQLQWKAGWVEVPRDETVRIVREVIAAPEWIYEGGNSATWRERLDRADLAIWLDFGVWTRLARVLRRSWRYRGQTRPDLAEGCPEVFGAQTIEFIRYIWKTRRSHEQRLRPILEAHETPCLHLCTGPDASRVGDELNVESLPHLQSKFELQSA